jgi:hypothetical protein
MKERMEERCGEEFGSRAKLPSYKKRDKPQ